MKQHVSRLITALCLLSSAPVFPATITNSEIDQFIHSIPITNNLLVKVKAKVNQDGSLSKKLASAQLDGKYTRELVNEVKGWPEHSELEELVRQSGFESVEAWSLVVDRVFGVISSANWVVLMASMPNAKAAPELTRETNLFEYLNDEKNDRASREKYGKQLQEMCAKLCYDRSDLPVVSARFDEIKTALGNK